MVGHSAKRGTVQNRYLKVAYQEPCLSTAEQTEKRSVN
jgi:hypothetical protein